MVKGAVHAVILLNRILKMVFNDYDSAVCLGSVW